MSFTVVLVFSFKPKYANYLEETENIKHLDISNSNFTYCFYIVFNFGPDNNVKLYFCTKPT